MNYSYIYEILDSQLLQDHITAFCFNSKYYRIAERLRNCVLFLILKFAIYKTIHENDISSY